MTYHYFADVGGWRFVVLIHRGRKWIRFIDISTFEVYRRHVRQLATLKPYDAKPRKLAAAISKRRAMFKRCNVRFSKRAVQSAIEILREAQP